MGKTKIQAIEQGATGGGKAAEAPRLPLEEVPPEWREETAA